MRRIGGRAVFTSIVLAVALIAPTMGQAQDIIPQRAEAAAPIGFLKIDGIDGDATGESHGGHIELLSFSWDPKRVNAPPTPGPGELTVTTRPGRASPRLRRAAAGREVIPEMVLTIRRSGAPYHVVRLQDVSVASVRPTGDLEEIAFSYKKISYR